MYIEEKIKQGFEKHARTADVQCEILPVQANCEKKRKIMSLDVQCQKLW